MRIRHARTFFVSIGAALALGRIAAAQDFGDWGTPINLESIPGTSSEFNTSFNDGYPILAPDSLSLFMATNRPGGLGGIDIWAAHRNSPGEPFGAPVNLPAPINSTVDDFCPTPVLDNGLYFVSTRAGGLGAADIYFTQEVGGVWSDPQNLGPNINGPANEFSPSYFEDADGNSYLYFSSNREGGFEPGGTDSDIYFSANSGPAQLAPGLNTATDDIRPNVRLDGREVVFDSNRPGGLGGFDVLTASRDAIGDDWQTPSNVLIVNSEASETRASLSWHGSSLFFGSNRPGGEGQADIYVSTRAAVPEPGSSVLLALTAGCCLILRRSRRLMTTDPNFNIGRGWLHLFRAAQPHELGLSSRWPCVRWDLGDEMQYALNLPPQVEIEADVIAGEVAQVHSGLEQISFPNSDQSQESGLKLHLHDLPCGLGRGACI